MQGWQRIEEHKWPKQLARERPAKRLLLKCAVSRPRPKDLPMKQRKRKMLSRSARRTRPEGRLKKLADKPKPKRNTRARPGERLLKRRKSRRI